MNKVIIDEFYLPNEILIQIVIYNNSKGDCIGGYIIGMYVHTELMLTYTPFDYLDTALVLMQEAVENTLEAHKRNTESDSVPSTDTGSLTIDALCKEAWANRYNGEELLTMPKHRQ